MKEFNFDPQNQEMMARLRQMPIFDAMDPEQLRPLIMMARLRSYKTGEIIIEEGETDQLVYFLVTGACRVNVDGMDITTLNSVGEVFGEMGLVDHSPRSATITAQQATVCMVLDGGFLDKMKDVDKLASEALFYRIFSEILATRIRDANSKVLSLDEDLEDLSMKRPD